MNVADLLKPPARRDVKAMTTTLGQLKSGDQVRAVLMLDKYGVVIVEGQACWSNTVKNFLLGGLPIESGLKPDKSLLAISMDQAPATMTASNAPTANFGDYESLHELAQSIGHGDVVRATFEQKPYGQFIVTGTAVQTADRAVTAIGTMFISGVIGLELLGNAAEFNLPVPKVLVWDVAG